MMLLHRWLAILCIAALANGKPVQLADLQLPSSAAAHQQVVVDLFFDFYSAYKKYAWGHDDLRPVTESYADDWNGWGITIIDAMSTMWIMGLHDLFDEAVDYVETVDFSVSRTNDAVDLYATTIHDIGGLLSAYELSGKTRHVLVEKAEQVAQKLAYAFNESSGIPYPKVNFTDHTPVKDFVSIAGVGALSLEWNRLSLYTGNDTYRQLAEGAVKHIMGMPAVFPGMPAVCIDPSTGKQACSLVTWGAGSDAYFEYLIKYTRLTNTDDPSYVDAWLTAVDSSIKNLLKRSTVGDWYYLSDYNHQVLHVGSHLSCFDGGNWVLGGKLADNDTIIEIGLQLTDACWNTYASTATGIGPEQFAYMSSDGSFTDGSPPTQDQIDFYSKHGYYITDPDYFLRPDVLESNLYAWRATGDTKYLDNAASALQSFREYLPAKVAYAGIHDVNNVTSSNIEGALTFWFVEVLKYLYLTFDDPSHISLNDYVFNTECHPFEAPPAKSVYGPAAETRHLHIVGDGN